jgi:hypothetical protein
MYRSFDFVIANQVSSATRLWFLAPDNAIESQPRNPSPG